MGLLLCQALLEEDVQKLDSEKFLELARFFSVEDVTNVQSNLSASDEEIVERFLQDTIATAGVVAADDDSEQPKAAETAADTSNKLSDDPEEDDDAWLR